MDVFRVKPKGEDGHTYVSTRLPTPLVKRLNQLAILTGCTRNQLIQESLEFALERLELPPLDETQPSPQESFVAPPQDSSQME